jgi:hypothetical protein
MDNNPSFKQLSIYWFNPFLAFSFEPKETKNNCLEKGLIFYIRCNENIKGNVFLFKKI